MTAEAQLGFFGIALLLGLSPGPDNLFVLMQSATQGRRAGLLVTLGLCTGLLAHTAAVALGLAALLASSPAAFGALKLAGAAYLLYLAWGAWRAPAALSEQQGQPALQPWRLYGRGVLMNLSNPKVLAQALANSGVFLESKLLAGLAEAPAPKLVENAYLASKDANIDIPALPVEEIPQQFRRQSVYFETTEAPGTIIINPSQRVLHYVTGKNQAIRYGISVGRAGFEWSGEANITNRKPWPTWTPPKEMIERKPELEKWKDGQPGGLENPVGARALYLGSTLYRIHGTNAPWSIGSAVSSGCIRMRNEDVTDLYERVNVGTTVIVI